MSLPLLLQIQLKGGERYSRTFAYIGSKPCIMASTTNLHRADPSATAYVQDQTPNC